MNLIRCLCLTMVIGLAGYSMSAAQPISTDVAAQDVQFLGSTMTVPPGEDHIRTNIRLIDLPWARPEPDFLLNDPLGMFDRNGGAGDWMNHGGNEKKNGLSPVIGPSAESMQWEINETAIISFQPYILGDRLFAVRMKQFLGATANDRIHAYDLNTGNELWTLLLPYGGDSSQQWTAHILGVRDGVVYASRSGNGNSIEGKVTAYSADDGSFIWESEDTTDTGTYGGCVFAANGDLVVGSFDNIRRISAVDGSTVWTAARSCPTSGACVPALGPDGVFIVESRPGLQTAIAKYDLQTGAFLYRSMDTAGFITQNAPFIASDGQTIYHAKQHSTGMNFLYSFTDSQTALDFNWNRQIKYSAYHLHGVGFDGTVYTYLLDDEFVRLDPRDGAVLNTAGVLTPRSAGPQTAIDANGKVYFSNGWASSPASEGKLWALTANLQPLFDLDFQRQNSGGPALGNNGTLVVADLNGIRAYRTDVLLGDVNLDGTVNLLDVAPFVVLLQSASYQAEADINKDGVVNLLDVAPFVDLLSG